ncbi:MAG: hypothetical protein QOG38_2908, partial [Hyphomicrobiales bacterium]|nr:hypothetical protein [Hyphomicrobiales bacterium]
MNCACVRIENLSRLEAGADVIWRAFSDVL